LDRQRRKIDQAEPGGAIRPRGKQASASPWPPWSRRCGRPSRPWLAISRPRKTAPEPPPRGPCGPGPSSETGPGAEVEKAQRGRDCSRARAGSGEKCRMRAGPELNRPVLSVRSARISRRGAPSTVAGQHRAGPGEIAQRREQSLEDYPGWPVCRSRAPTIASSCR